MTESTVKQCERNKNFRDNLCYIQEVADDLSYKHIIKILRDSMYDTEEFNIRKKEFERFLSRPLKENKKFYAQSYIEVFAVLNIYTKFVNEVYNLYTNDPTTEKIELVMVGQQSMVVPNAETIEWLAHVKDYLVKQRIADEQYSEFDEMINALESAMCTLDCARKSFESHKDESLKIQDIIKSCDGFITFKEWLGLIASESSYDDYEDLLTQFAWDDEFPSNSDSSWKSYRILLKYIMKKWHYRFWDDFKKLYYEYQNILEGRWFP